MAIEILFDVFIKNEYGVENKATDYVNSYKENRKVGTLYNTCEIYLKSFDVPMVLSGDGVMRIRVERVIGGVVFSDNYIIDELTVKNKSEILIVGKTEGALLFEPYFFSVTKLLNYSTYNEVFSELLSGITTSMQIPLIPNSTHFYEIANETYGSVILSLAKKLGIDVYVKDGAVVMEEIKRIFPNDVPKVSFAQIDCLSATLDNKESSGLGIIYINPKSSEVSSSASTALSVSLEPQPIRPAITKTWIDPQTNDVYTMPPIDCKMKLFFNPLNVGEPEILGFDFYKEYNSYMVEEFDLVSESCIELLGGIRGIAGMTITDGTETTATSVAYGQYDNGTLYADIVLFTSILDVDNLADADGIQINVLEGGVDEAISSTITGTGTDADPYVYDIYLGTVENIEAEKATANISIGSTYSFTNITETLALEAKLSEATLNGHNIKVDGTGLVKTSGYDYSAGETIFYVDPAKTYDSLATVVFNEILNSATLPYTATITSKQDNVQLTVVETVQTCGTFSGGVDEVYSGQRDNMAITQFVRADTNASGLITTELSDDTSNPTTLPPTIVLNGGMGDASSIISGFNGWNFEVGHNVLCFGIPITGKVRVAYFTDVYVATVPNHEYETNIPVAVSHLDSILRHTHQIRAVDYFPLTYIHRLDVADTWSIDYEDAYYREIAIYKVDNYSGSETQLEVVRSDATGILMLKLGNYGYGQYALYIGGVPQIYIRYYANMFDIGTDKIIIKEAMSDTGCA